MSMGPVPERLREFFSEHPKVALAYSGGSDSSYLLYTALACNVKVKAYFIKSQFQKKTELDHALDLAESLGQEVDVVHIDVLDDPSIAANPADRCYLCKKKLFSKILEESKKSGLDTVVDATNASDDASDRPGMKALTELGILSPLKESGITKPMLRDLSRKAGLKTWDLPSDSCLATRIPSGMVLTAENLERTERTEYLLGTLGLREFRLRTTSEGARLETIDSDKETVEHLKNDIERIVLGEYASLEYGRRDPRL